MISRNSIRLAVFLVAGGLAVFSALNAMTAGNTVAQSHAGVITQTITPKALAPAACSGLTLTNLVTGSGTDLKGSADSLILANTGNDKLGSNGEAFGPDCCVGGSGDDTFERSCAVTVP
jgi:hypothetical protein